MMKYITILGILALLSMFIVPALALPNVNFTTNTPNNATWRNGTVGLSNILINVSSNETIHINASTFIEWYNATNASSNVSAISSQVVNYSGSLSQNWTYWAFNLSNDGVHRFVVRVYSTNSSGANAPIERYVYYDNTSSQPSFSFPVNNTDYVRSPPFNFTMDINFTGHDATSTDRCFYDLNSVGNTSISSCTNTTFVVASGSNSVILWINDSAGNTNSSRITFTARETSLGGGGGGGGVTSQIQVARITLGNLPANALQITPVTGNVPVNKLEFRTTTQLSFSMDIEKLTMLPVPDPPGVVFDRLNLKPSTVQGITDMVIHFKVSKFDMQNKGVSASNVVLMRYQNSWFTLPTEQTSEDSIFVYYKAKTPGFSYFAITSGTQAVTPQYQIQPTGDAQTLSLPNWGELDLGGYKIPVLWLIVGIVILIILIVLVRR